MIVFSILASIFILTCLSRSQANNVERTIIFSDKVPEPLAFYSQAVQVGNTLYISGNLGMTKDGNLVEGISNQTKLALDNIGHILEAAGVSFDHVVKVTVMLSDIQDYGAMNDIYGLYFNEKAPARSAYAVAKLPRDAYIEIEAVAIVGNLVDANHQSNIASGTHELLSILVLLLGSTTVCIFIS